MFPNITNRYSNSTRILDSVLYATKGKSYKDEFPFQTLFTLVAQFGGLWEIMDWVFRIVQVLMIVIRYTVKHVPPQNKKTKEKKSDQPRCSCLTVIANAKYLHWILLGTLFVVVVLCCWIISIKMYFAFKADTQTTCSLADGESQLGNMFVANTNTLVYNGMAAAHDLIRNQQLRQYELSRYALISQFNHTTGARVLELQRRHDNETRVSSQMLAIQEHLRACFSGIQNGDEQTISIYNAFTWSYEEAFPEQPPPLAFDYIPPDCRWLATSNALPNMDIDYTVFGECDLAATCAKPDFAAAEAKVNHSICTFQQLLLWWWKRGMLIIGFYVILNLARTLLFHRFVKRYLLFNDGYDSLTMQPETEDKRNHRLGESQ
jgi:hypothetical protein